MFSKKAQTDVKKSVHKILDSKKDIATRFKHLKFLLGTFCMQLFNCCFSSSKKIMLLFCSDSDENESKQLFESNYSSIYQIFYESFISVEANLKQRGKIIWFLNKLYLFLGSSSQKVRFRNLKIIILYR